MPRVSVAWRISSLLTLLGLALGIGLGLEIGLRLVRY